MAKLRLGVIGAGAWTVWNHLPVLAKRRDDLEFTGVARKGAEELERIRADWGFAVASEDYRDVLAAGVDVCVVASPAALHHEHAAAAMRAGAHVLVEKPFTISSDDAWDLVRIAEEEQRHLVVSFGWNWGAVAQRARDLMREHPLGRLEHLEISMASPMRELFSAPERFEYEDGLVPDADTWNDPQLAGGGYGQAQLTHALGVGLWLTGLRARHAVAFLSTPNESGVELHDAIAVRYDGGATGTVSGYSAHGDEFRTELRAVGSEGQLHVVLEVGRERIALTRGGEEPIVEEPAAGAGEYECIGPPNTLVDLALGRDVENAAPAELGARTAELLELAYRGAVPAHA